MFLSESTVCEKVWFVGRWSGKERVSGLKELNTDPAPSFGCCGALGKFLSLLEPQSPHPSNGNFLISCTGCWGVKLRPLCSALEIQE